MEDLEKFKKLLGPLAEEYNDAQLLQLRREMRQAADLLLDIYLWRKQGKGQKSPLTNSAAERKMSP